MCDFAKVGVPAGKKPEEAQANAALAAMKADTAKMIAKDTHAGVVIPPQH
ncbi:hypothetical protein GGI1_20663 [Acidithiobacillus sp. GGI-221]|nr:hypothetical protein GGI1_20663 [Acidithiobacillus sp. GGI-221]BDB15728.1 hypothetical protein ANFP_30480 [Acidithiobacillus ferrooxidans]